MSPLARGAEQEHQQGIGDVLQLVSFRLANEEYGIDILRVQEINRMLAINRIPMAPDYLEGIVNLRGRVIPVISLRKLFGMGNKEQDKSTRIVVVDAGEKTFGLIADSVSKVLRLPLNTVEPPPPVVSKSMEYIQGVGRIGERLLILLDLRKLLKEFEIVIQDAVDQVLAKGEEDRREQQPDEKKMQ